MTITAKCSSLHSYFLQSVQNNTLLTVSWGYLEPQTTERTRVTFSSLWIWWPLPFKGLIFLLTIGNQNTDVHAGKLTLKTPMLVFLRYGSKVNEWIVRSIFSFKFCQVDRGRQLAKNIWLIFNLCTLNIFALVHVSFQNITHLSGYYGSNLLHRAMSKLSLYKVTDGVIHNHYHK